MTQRRGSVTGSVKKRDNGHWRARYWDRDGKQHSRQFALKGMADEWLRDQLQGVATGVSPTPPPAASDDPQFDAYAKQWLRAKRKTKVKGRPISPNTIALYEDHYRVHIAPKLGALPMSAVTESAIRAWHDDLTAKPKNGNPELGPLSQSSCAKTYRLLRQMCATAVKQGLLPKNPCDIEGAATEPDYSLSYEEPPDAGEVRALAKAVPDRYRAMVLLAGFGGLRWGEVTGLQRRHVDTKTGVVKVRQQLNRQGSSSRIGLSEPKTTAGRREVGPTDEVVRALKTHLAKYVGGDESAFLFTAPEGGVVRHQNFRKRVWLPATAAVGKPDRRFHDLRHAAATFLAIAGASTKGLMAQMGHRSEKTALRYQHATQNERDAVVERLNALLAVPAADNVVELRRPS